jgi:hypothetical protein
MDTDMKLKNLNLKNKKIEIIRTNYFSRESVFKRILNKFLIFFFGKSFCYEKFFNNLKIKAISHSSICLGRKSAIKSFPWIPDFQFMHYPENFSVKNRIFKKINIFFAANAATKIIISSKDSQNDLKKFSIRASNKSVVHSFKYETVEKNKIITLNNICQKYQIKTKFFYLPNQYFFHKNHIVVLKSLKYLLKDSRHKNILILSSGLNRDHRQNNYYDKIVNYIKYNSLQNNFIYLGVIPYEHVMSLVYHSVAVINPSKFEGWSSTVEQANAMAKKIILSNINVHIEQNPMRGYFFNPNNYIYLSSIMKRLWSSHKINVEKKFFLKNFQYQNKLFLDYGLRYQKIILDS